MSTEKTLTALDLYKRFEANIKIEKDFKLHYTIFILAEKTDTCYILALHGSISMSSDTLDVNLVFNKSSMVYLLPL